MAKQVKKPTAKTLTAAKKATGGVKKVANKKYNKATNKTNKKVVTQKRPAPTKVEVAPAPVLVIKTEKKSLLKRILGVLGL
mgnify:CR=1 FL=1